MPHRFLSFLGNLGESGGIKNGRGASQNCHSGGHIFQGNEAIPELRPECSPESTGTECDQKPLIRIKDTCHICQMITITFAHITTITVCVPFPTCDTHHPALVIPLFIITPPPFCATPTLHQQHTNTMEHGMASTRRGSGIQGTPEIFSFFFILLTPPSSAS